MSALAPALRIARRDAMRHKGRSLLVVALVALPVLVLTAVDVLHRSSQASPLETVNSLLVDAEAMIWAPTGARSVTQGPADVMPAAFDFGVSGIDPKTTYLDIPTIPLRPPQEILPMLPAGSTITPFRQIEIPIGRGDGRYLAAMAELVDMTAPAARGRYRIVDGTAPTAPGHVVVTKPLAAELGLTVGSTLSAGSPAREAAVVGIVDPNFGNGDVHALVAIPDSIATGPDWTGPRYLVADSGPISWTKVQELNSHGLQVYSRAAILGGEAHSQTVDPLSEAEILTTVTIIVIVGLGLLQVIFLAGPAFAINARRMRRQLGLAAAVGAAPGQVRTVTLASGLVLGTAGSLIGAGLGVAAGVAAQPLIESTGRMRFTAVHLHPLDIAIAIGIGVITSVIAALPPAISAQRASPISALGRTPSPTKSAGIWSLIGLVGCGAGILVTVFAATSPLPENPTQNLEDRGLALAAGMFLSEIGLLMATPLILVTAAKLGGSLPTTPRLALRDAARHRGRSTPAVAAIMAATSAAVVASIILASTDAEIQAEYRPTLRVNQALVAGNDWANQSPFDSSDMAELVDRHWPGSSISEFHEPRSTNPEHQINAVVPAERRCPWFDPGIGPYQYDPEESRQPPTPAEMPRASVDPRCFNMRFSTLSALQAHTSLPSYFGPISVPPFAIGGPEFRFAATGVADPAADAALQAGGIVVLDQRFLSDDGLFRTEIFRWEDGQEAPVIVSNRAAPAVLGAWGATPFTAIVSPAAAAQLGVEVSSGPTLLVATGGKCLRMTKGTSSWPRRLLATRSVPSSNAGPGQRLWTTNHRSGWSCSAQPY